MEEEYFLFMDSTCYTKNGMPNSSDSIYTSLIEWFKKQMYIYLKFIIGFMNSTSFDPSHFPCHCATSTSFQSISFIAIPIIIFLHHRNVTDNDIFPLHLLLVYSTESRLPLPCCISKPSNDGISIHRPKCILLSAITIILFFF